MLQPFFIKLPISPKSHHVNVFGKANCHIAGTFFNNGAHFHFEVLLFRYCCSGWIVSNASPCNKLLAWVSATCSGSHNASFCFTTGGNIYWPQRTLSHQWINLLKNKWLSKKSSKWKIAHLPMKAKYTMTKTSLKEKLYINWEIINNFCL